MEIFTRKWSEISGGRFDSNFYRQDFMQNKAKLQNLNARKLNDLVTFSSQTYIFEKENSNKPFSYIEISGINLEDGNITATTLLEKDAPSRAKMLIQENDIIISSTRPNRGAITIIPKSLNGQVASTGFIVIREASNEILRKYLSIALKLKFSLLQMEQRSTGGNYPAIIQSDLEQILIPLPSKEIQQQIIDIMDNAYLEKKRKESEAQKILDSIDSFLLAELGINLLPKTTSDLKKRIFFVKLSEISGKRFDPQAYLPFYANYKKSIQNSTYPCKTLRDLIVHNVSGSWGIDEQDLEKTQDNFQKCLIIRSTEFGKYDLNVDSNKKQYRFIEKTKLNKLHICSGDILIEKSGGSENQPVGRVAFLTDKLLESENICFSNFIQKITLNNEVNKEYVFVAYILFIRPN